MEAHDDSRAPPALEPFGAGSLWIGLLVVAVLGAAAAAVLLWDLDVLMPPAPEVPAEVMEILELAASQGIFAYDAPSGLTSLPVAALPETAYRLSVTARRLDARPDTVISMAGREECVALARALADLRGAVGFCRPDR